MNELEIEQRLKGEAGSSDGWDEVTVRLGAGAVRAGLDELAFAGHESPFGTMLVAASDAGIVRIALAAESESAVLEQLARRISPRIVRVERPPITEARRQLDGYFTGEVRRFELPLDWRLTGGFRREVLRETEAIPFGSTASYAEMAERAGSARAVRAAGTALATNPLPIVVPCHRVLRSDGRIGAYLGGSPMKQSLLEMERELSGG